ncbi:hypothetical protein HJG60_008545 [Phyllostomus discolor]|uniref:Uncharacterized protein n=1 Tax=Phyllostomus discolor TaxID=89673 RepID=A0A834DL71_9CHIR|nr:hypothetical protein HJG60_008545 [Phyllostomus discolor]
MLFHMRFLVSPLFGGACLCHLNIHVLKLYPRGNGIRRWGLWGAIRWRWGRERRAPRMGLAPVGEEEATQDPASLRWVRRWPEGGRWQAGRVTLPGTKSADTVIPGVPAPDCEKEMSVVYPTQFMVFSLQQPRLRPHLQDYLLLTSSPLSSLHPTDSSLLSAAFPVLCASAPNYFNDNTSDKFV